METIAQITKNIHADLYRIYSLLLAQIIKWMISSANDLGNSVCKLEIFAHLTEHNHLECMHSYIVSSVDFIDLFTVGLCNLYINKSICSTVQHVCVCLCSANANVFICCRLEIPHMCNLLSTTKTDRRRYKWCTNIRAVFGFSMQIDGDSRGNSNNDSKMDDNISDIVDNSKPNRTNENANWIRETRTETQRVHKWVWLESISAINSISFMITVGANVRATNWQPQCCLLSICLFFFPSLKKKWIARFVFCQSQSCSTFLNAAEKWI